MVCEGLGDGLGGMRDADIPQWCDGMYIDCEGEDRARIEKMECLLENQEVMEGIFTRGVFALRFLTTYLYVNFGRAPPHVLMNHTITYNIDLQ